MDTEGSVIRSPSVISTVIAFFFVNAIIITAQCPERHLRIHLMPKVELINPGFTTADAGYPSMRYESGNLQLRFNDWRERSVLVTFHNVRRFEWSDEPDDFFDGEPFDGTCLIRKSGWVPRNAAGECQHYRLNFNACGGRLDVACVSLDVAEEER